MSVENGAVVEHMTRREITSKTIGSIAMFRWLAVCFSSPGRMEFEI